MVFHGFSWNQKLLQMVSHDLWAQNWNIVFRLIWNVWFPKISIPPPLHGRLFDLHPHPPGFSVPGGLWRPPSPQEVSNGDFAKHPLEMNPPPLQNFQWSSGGGGGGMDFFWNHTILGLRNMILRLPCTCQWTVDLIRKSGFCSKSQNPTVDFNNVFKVDFK